MYSIISMYVAICIAWKHLMDFSLMRNPADISFAKLILVEFLLAKFSCYNYDILSYSYDVIVLHDHSLLLHAL